MTMRFNGIQASNSIWKSSSTTMSMTRSGGRRCFSLLSISKVSCSSTLTKKHPSTTSITSPTILSISKSSSNLNLNLNLTTPNRRFSSTTGNFKTIKDPLHPTGIYYHSLPDDQVPATSSSNSTSSPTSSPKHSSKGSTSIWALSLLPKPPTSSSSISILGYISLPEATSSPSPSSPSPSSEEQDRKQGQDVPTLVRQNPDLLQPNRSFMRYLHEILKNKVVGKDESLAFEATMRRDGWAHLSDARHELMPGRIPTPDSIFSTVAFQEGRFLINESNYEGYEINETYRIVTKEEGPIQLRQEWLDIVRSELEKVN